MTNSLSPMGDWSDTHQKIWHGFCSEHGCMHKYYATGSHKGFFIVCSPQELHFEFAVAIQWLFWARIEILNNANQTRVLLIKIFNCCAIYLKPFNFILNIYVLPTHSNWSFFTIKHLSILPMVLQDKCSISMCLLLSLYLLVNRVCTCPQFLWCKFNWKFTAINSANIMTAKICGTKSVLVVLKWLSASKDATARAADTDPIHNNGLNFPCWLINSINLD